MDIIDFKQLVDNLKETMSHKEIKEATGLKKIKPEELQQAFEDAQKLAELHLKVCPDLHTQEILLVNT